LKVGLVNVMLGNMIHQEYAEWQTAAAQTAKAPASDRSVLAVAKPETAVTGGGRNRPIKAL